MVAIVVIDDDPMILSSMEFVLKEQGYEVFITGSGADGIDLLESTGAEVVISDVFMPDKDGIEVVVEAKKHFPNVKRILMSGGGHKSDFRMLSISEGTLADATLTKPVSAQNLVAAVESVLY